MAESGLIITEASVKADWDRLRELERQVADARAAFDLQAALLKAKGFGSWLPHEAATSAPAEGRVAVRKGRAPAARGTWTSEIMLVLRDSPEGIIRADLRERLAAGPMAEKLRRNPNGYYNGFATLEKRGEISEYKGRIFAPDLLKAFLARVRSGEVEDLSGDDAHPPTILDALTDYVNANPHGMPANEIVKAMEGKGMAAGTVYNNLSKAVTRNKIRREGKNYFPVNENEPPPATPGSGSETGGVTAPPIENQGTRKLDLD